MSAIQMTGELRDGKIRPDQENVWSRPEGCTMALNANAIRPKNTLFYDRGLAGPVTDV